MKIVDLLDRRSILLEGSAKNKEDALNQMVDLMNQSGKLSDKNMYRKGVFEREKEGTTGVGAGIAIPHCKSSAVKEAGLAAMIIPEGVPFNSLDGEPVKLIFLIAAPNSEDNVHLDVLSKLSVLLMDEKFVEKLIKAKNIQMFLDIIDAEEEKKDKRQQDTKSILEKDKTIKNDSTDHGVGSVVIHENSKNNDQKPFVLAVTACPTGIAHTYMAAEALEKRAEEMGIRIKVETRGSGGVRHLLSQTEIAKADAVIVAADTKVPMDRFRGKPVIVTKVADGINKAEELLRRAISGEVALYGEPKQGVGSSSQVSPNETSSNRTHFHEPEEAFESEVKKGSSVYKHLMNGVSHMLPFVIGGGIWIAVAFLLDTLAGYGADGGGNFGSMTPLAAFFKYVGGLAMGLMVPVLSGYIAYSIADRPGLAVGFTGGLIASSGNAKLAEMVFADKVDQMGALNRFISNFGFQTEHGGSTVSGFLGGIVAGFLAGFIVLMLKRACENLPDALEGVKPTLIYPVCGIFLVALLMCFVFNPLIGLINELLSEMLTAVSNAGFITILGLILGAMMAIDMGGPINKAAYVFGTGMLATAGNMLAEGMDVSSPAVQACYIAMASIMVGGMVPPVGIALATWMFPDKFTKAERGSAVSNIVMGASFITEGAIPFAAADPVHVIPCTMAGAGVAGLLSAWFSCTLMAPHGGIFVFATVGHPFLYILAWVIGSMVTAVLLGLIKKVQKA